MTERTAILVSANTGAALLDISPATFWRRVKDKTLPEPIRIAGVTRWKRDELMAAIERLSDNGEEKTRLALQRSPGFGCRT